MQTSNKPTFFAATYALVIIASLVLGCGRFGSQPRGGVGDLINEPVPSVDPTEPFPALSAGMIDAFITELPELSKYRDVILNAERTAINGVLEDVRAKSRAANGNFSDTIHGSASLSGSASLLQMPSRYETRTEGGQRAADFSGHLSFTQAALAAAPEISSVLSRDIQSYLIGHQIGFTTPDYEKARAADRDKTKIVPVTDESTGRVLATTTVSVTADGNISNEISTTLSLPPLGIDSNSRVKLTGNQCPNADGKLDLTVEHSSNGRAGSSGSFIYDKNITATIKASVNEDAEVASIDLDLKQSTRSTAGGRQVYIETSQSGQGGTGAYEDIKLGDVRIDRASSQATSADQSISDDGLKAAYRLAQGVLKSAEERWKGGGCVEIIATSPGTVAVNSTTPIPVKVMHKFDGTEVRSKLTAELSGGASIDPTLIPKTAGTLNYVAPSERGKSATIKLTANSKRGRAKLELTASTREQRSYHAEGSSDGAFFKGDICDRTKPFTIDVDSKTGKWSMKFTPENDSAGNMEGTFSANGCTLTGGGPYTITIGEDGSGTITFTYNSTATCPVGKPRTTSKTSTLPLKPAPDLKCN